MWLLIITILSHGEPYGDVRATFDSEEACLEDGKYVIETAINDPMMDGFTFTMECIKQEE